MHQQALDKNILLCPGVGFDIVPTDCLAAMLADKQPGSQTINLAFASEGKPSIGTIKTAIEGITAGGFIRENHTLRPVPSGYQIRKIRFADKERPCVTIPWADVYTSGISTGVPNGMVFTALPLVAALFLKATLAFQSLLGKPSIQKRLVKLAEKYFAGGPSESERQQHTSRFWGEAITADGHRTEAVMTAPSAYALTVDTAVAITRYCLSNDQLPSGYVTPAMLMGRDFILSRPGVTLRFL